ncbi:unnamed protein product [Ceratitis capitata]|uniref:(Mediterranean fruit fly) hypothetical protein n=1 Tax=Ceratitis capitata TaxID=7213 RepID=A0A811U5N6_CERCA|nr:unnamed protein product [Ceratitis capitata]
MGMCLSTFVRYRIALHPVKYFSITYNDEQSKRRRAMLEQQFVSFDALSKTWLWLVASLRTLHHILRIYI